MASAAKAGSDVRPKRRPEKSAEWFTENPWDGEAEIHEDYSGGGGGSSGDGAPSDRLGVCAAAAAAAAAAASAIESTAAAIQKNGRQGTSTESPLMPTQPPLGPWDLVRG